MIITLPNKLIIEAGSIESCILKFKNSEDSIISIHPIKKEHLLGCKQHKKNLFIVNDQIFNKAFSAEFDIEYINGSLVLPIIDKNSLIKKPKLVEEAKQITIKNNDVIYADTQEDKELIMSIVDNLYTLALAESTDYHGHGTLIYYTISKDPNYIPLLEKSITTLIQNNLNEEFTILIITTESIKNLLNEISIFKNTRINYHLIDEPMNSVQASMLKLNIYDYVDIQKYRNILFLDCDVLCLGNIKELLQPLQTDKLLTVCNPLVPISSHLSLFHGLDMEDTERINNIYTYNQLPFNAGHFMFKNSLRMKHHFENIRWLSKIWPGKFFFEQCFMNRYFCGFNLTNFNILASQFELISTVKNNYTTKLHTKNTKFIHFIAPPLNPTAKLVFINNYCDAHQLSI